MMKPYIAALALAILSCGTTQAETLVSAKDASKAVLKLNAYDANGKLLRQSTAFYVDEQGNAVAPYVSLVGASSAEVVDMKGKKYSVYRILGANSATDLVKFSLVGVKKPDYFSITNTSATQGQQLQMLRYTTDKKQVPVSVQIEKAEAYNSYNYYNVSAKNDSVNFSCPVIDDNGDLIAIVQKNVGKNATSACAIDARFINDLKYENSISALSSDLTSLNIPKALPASKTEAMNLLFMLPQNDSLRCMTAYNDFIEQYPDLPDGYVYRANFWANRGQLSKADSEFQTALDKSKTCKDSAAQTTDAIYYNWSNLIYTKVLEQGKDSTLTNNWNLTKAIEEADNAYAASPSLLYKVQKGKCLYAMRRYQESYDNFSQACADTHFASHETFFSAAKSLEMAGGDDKQVLALLDSCIARIPENAGSRYAQYYLERSQRLLKAQKYREAVADYNKYEQMVGPRNLDERFYYLRSQAETQAHLYQQAFDDLQTCANISKSPLPYKVEAAALMVNVGEYTQAVSIAEEALKNYGDNADCYKILGIAHGELKHKTQAAQYLNKAINMGDTDAIKYLEKYK